MEKRDEIIELYLIYKNMLTENDRKYFENYYFEDYSLTEIADNENVSKANVSKVLNNVDFKLYDYESKLNININHKKIRKIIISEKNEKLLSKIDELL